MPSTPDSFYAWGKAEPLDVPSFNKRFLDLSHRLQPLEALQVSYAAVLADVEDKVLAQTEAVLAGLRAQLAAIVQLEWLTAVSATPIALVAAQDRSLIVPDSDRALFAPGPYAVVQRTGDPATYAVVQTTNFDRTLGQFDFHVLTVAGDTGVHADWSIAAVAGSTLAQMTALTQGLAALATTQVDAAAAHLDRLAADADAVQTAADRAAITSAIQAGPVQSVGGLTGVIAAAALKNALGLVLADIAGVKAAAGKDLGSSVTDPGTGKLEVVLPVQARTGASMTFGAGDLFFETRRSNGGAAMTDSFPAANVAGMTNGTRLVTNNVDPTASITVLAPSGTQVNGGDTVIIGPLRSVEWVLDKTVSPPTWRSTKNGLNGLLASNALGEIAAAGLASTALTNLGVPAAITAAVGSVVADSAAASQDIRTLALIVSGQAGFPIGLTNGGADAFNNQADVNTSASSGQTYDATNRRYSNQSATFTTVSTPAQAISSGDSSGSPKGNAFDGNASTSWMSSTDMVAVSGVAYIGQDFGAAKAVRQVVYTAGVNAATPASVLVQSSDNGTAWVTAATANPAPNATTTITVPVAAGSHRFWRLLANANGGAAGYNWTVIEAAFQVPTAPANMVLQSIALASSIASPASARVVVQIDPSSDPFSLNTDLKGYVSRDGGTTFTQGTLVTGQSLGDGTAMFDTGLIAIGAQPAGASMVWRLVTSNSKLIVVSGVVLQWKA